jgi:hypothetical protein
MLTNCPGPTHTLFVSTRTGRRENEREVRFARALFRSSSEVSSSTTRVVVDREAILPKCIPARSRTLPRRETCARLPRRCVVVPAAVGRRVERGASTESRRDPRAFFFFESVVSFPGVVRDGCLVRVSRPSPLFAGSF